MTLSYDLKETNSKVEQGNDTFNSVRRQRQLHSNWALLNISRPWRATQQQSPQQ